MNKFVNYILPFVIIIVVVFGGLYLFGGKSTMDSFFTTYEPNIEPTLPGTKTLILKTDKVFSHLCVKDSQRDGKNPFKQFDLNYIKNNGLQDARSSDARFKGKIKSGKIIGKWIVRSANGNLQRYYEKVIRGLNGAYTTDSQADVELFISVRRNIINIEVDNFKPVNFSENRICELTGRPKYFVPAQGFNVTFKKRGGYMQNENSGKIISDQSGDYKYYSYIPLPKEYRK